MNATNTPRAARRALLVRRYRSLRVSGAAALSLLTVRAIEAETSREAARLAARITKERTHDRAATDDDNAIAAASIPMTGEAQGVSLSGYLLTPADRATLAADLGRAPRALVTVTPAPAALDEPLPRDYVAAPVESFTPALIADPQIEAEAARDAAAVGFESDYDEHPADYAPIAVEIARPTPAPVNPAPVPVAPAPRQPKQNFAQFLAARGMLAAL